MFIHIVSQILSRAVNGKKTSIMDLEAWSIWMDQTFWMKAPEAILSSATLPTLGLVCFILSLNWLGKKF